MGRKKGGWKHSPKDILEIIDDVGQASPYYVSKKLGVNYNTVKRYLEALESEGKVVRIELERNKNKLTLWKVEGVGKTKWDGHRHN